MAAAELTPVVLSRLTGISNDGTDISTGDMVDWNSDTGFYIDYFDTTQNNQDGTIVLFISNASSAATDGAINVLSSTQSVFTGSGITDMDIDLTTEATVAEFDTEAADYHVTCFALGETARFVDTDGYINFEYDTDHKGMVTEGHAFAIVVPDAG